MYNVVHKDSGSRQHAAVKGKTVRVPVYEVGDVQEALRCNPFNDTYDMYEEIVRLPQRLQNRSKAYAFSSPAKATHQADDIRVGYRGGKQWPS
jgi:hypothetical protein